MKKRSLIVALFLLMVPLYTLHAAKSVYQPIIQLQKGDGTAGLPRSKRKLLVHGYCRKYDVPKALCWLIIYFVHDNPRQYKNKPLPHDLSGQDLSGFDFTGCAFTYTNLAYSDLTNVILTNTICDYQKAFQDNIKKNKLRGGDWYKNNLPKDLKSIAAVYPQLNNNTQKAWLLHIASAFSQLPFHEGTEFYIKVEYWSSALLQLKQTLDSPYGQQLICSLQGSLEYDANYHCWTTNYPQDKVNIDAKVPHANFDNYLKDFTNGLTNYQCKSKDNWYLNWYKEEIINSIKGLKRTYPNIKSAQLRQTACDIAYILSKSYQIRQMVFQHHYLFCQHRLIRLKKSVDLEIKNQVYCNACGRNVMSSCWRRVKSSIPQL